MSNETIRGHIRLNTLNTIFVLFWNKTLYVVTLLQIHTKGALCSKLDPSGPNIIHCVKWTTVI